MLSIECKYNQRSIDFINNMGIGYAQEIYEENGQCTICEDGQPKAWCWDTEQDKRIWNK